MILKEKRVDCAADATSSIDRELAACELADARLDERLRTLLEQIGGSVGESIPMACQDWANTKAAYRFFSNDRVNEADILAGHFQATKERFTATQGQILILHDTTEFSFQRKTPTRSESLPLLMAERVKTGAVPTVNPKQLSIACESVDNHLRWVISSS